jgi:hypothetical protein
LEIKDLLGLKGDTELCWYLESNVSDGDTCKEIGVTRHGSENADKVQKHNAEYLSVPGKAWDHASLSIGSNHLHSELVI